MHTLKKGGAVGAMPPTHYLSKPGGGGGARGGRIQGPGPATPPPRGRRAKGQRRHIRLCPCLKHTWMQNCSTRYTRGDTSHIMILRKTIQQT